MDGLKGHSQISRDISDNKVDLEALIMAYQDGIVRICARYARDSNEAEELAQEFLAVKLFEKDLVGKFQLRSEKSVPFRKYLYRAVAFHCIERGRGKNKKKEVFQDPVEMDFGYEQQAGNAREDLEWAMGLLHRAFSKVREFYVGKGKEHYWLIFKESILDKALKPFNLKDETTLFTGVLNAEAELSKLNMQGEIEQIRLKYLPNSKRNQEIFNIQTTVKRMLITTLEMIFEAEAEDKDDLAEKNRVYQDWIEILHRFDESTFTAMRAALRLGSTADHLTSERSSVSVEMGMRIDFQESQITSDELAYLLTYRIDMPLSEWMDSRRLMELIPSKSPFMPRWRTRDLRPLSLGVILDPTPAESEAIDKIGMAELLRQIKESSKKLANSRNHAVPPQIFMLFYTLTSLLGLTRHHVKLYSISDQEMKQNVAWYLKQEWLDNRIARFFKQVVNDPRGL